MMMIQKTLAVALILLRRMTKTKIISLTIIRTPTFVTGTSINLTKIDMSRYITMMMNTTTMATTTMITTTMGTTTMVTMISITTTTMEMCMTMIMNMGPMTKNKQILKYGMVADTGDGTVGIDMVGVGKQL